MEQLPGYAPDLNPAEGVWHYLKHVALRNLCCADLDELAVELDLAVKRLRHKAQVLRGCITECGYGTVSAGHPAPLVAAECRDQLTDCAEAA